MTVGVTTVVGIAEGFNVVTACEGFVEILSVELLRSGV